MTKPVVSIAALMLVERGELALTDPVSRYLEKFGAPVVLGTTGKLETAARPITVEDLLTHRAGLSYDFQPGCPVAGLYRESRLAADGGRTLAEVVDLLASMPLAKHPGACWYYSYGTDVLARLLEVVAGRPLGELLRELLFEPLGMDDTAFGVRDQDRTRLVAMHGLRDLDIVGPEEAPEQWLRPIDVESSYPTDRPDHFARGGLGLCSTLDDYLRFMTLLMEGRTPGGEQLLSERILDRAWTDHLLKAQRPIAIGTRAFPGYGWGLFGRVMVDPTAAGFPGTVGEGGWSGAASTWFWVDRRRRFSGIVLAQYLGASVQLGEEMQAAAYRALAAPL